MFTGIGHQLIKTPCTGSSHVYLLSMYVMIWLFQIWTLLEYKVLVHYTFIYWVCNDRCLRFNYFNQYWIIPLLFRNSVSIHINSYLCNKVVAVIILEYGWPVKSTNIDPSHAMAIPQYCKRTNLLLTDLLVNF